MQFCRTIVRPAGILGQAARLKWLIYTLDVVVDHLIYIQVVRLVAGGRWLE